jgi:hypothetical protein
MRLLRLLPFQLPLAVLFAGSAFAQYVSSPPDLLTAPVRDPQALGVVQNAIAAMGGAAITQIQNLTIRGQSTAEPGTPLVSGPVTWRMAGAEFRMDVPGPNGPASVMTGHGKPALIDGKTSALKPYVTQAMFVPPAVAAVLMQKFENQKMSLRFKGTEVLNGESVSVVTTALEMDFPDNVVTPQTWYFASSGLPVRVEFRSPDIKEETRFIPSAVDLSNYQAVSGVAYPFKIVLSLDGQVQTVYTIQSVTANSGIAAGVFDTQVDAGGAL